MAVEGVLVCWPDKAETEVRAHVARTHPELQHYNVVSIRAAKTYVYWASPTLRAPAKDWHLHAASMEGRNLKFDPAKESAVLWEHFSVAADGLTGFRFSDDRTYSFYLTADPLSEDELKARHLPWPVYIHKPEDRPYDVRILFPAQRFDSDPHGIEKVHDFDLDKPTGLEGLFNKLLALVEETAEAFESDEHKMLGDEAQALVDAYALTGLIDGGAMISSNGRPIEQWEIKIPHPTDYATRPYGYVDSDKKFHWHYILPDALFQQSGDRWTAHALKTAIGAGDAVALSVGQIIMLAGDYFVTFADMVRKEQREPVNIMKGIDDEGPLAYMILDVVSVEHSNISRVAPRVEALQNLDKMRFMQKVSRDRGAAPHDINWPKVKAVAAALRWIRGSTNYSELHALAQLIANENGLTLIETERLLPWARAGVRAQLAEALSEDEIEKLDTMGFREEAFSLGVTNGHYAELALHNDVHFSKPGKGNGNWDEFEAYHRTALQNIDDHMTGNPGHLPRSPIPAHAIAKTAFGLHFLTDAFSAGHMRVPRAVLGEAGSLASKLMHDMDGKFGLWVTNGFGEEWRAYGDSFLRASKMTDDQKDYMSDLWHDRRKRLDPDANWKLAKAAVDAAFRQLHYHAQRYYSPSAARASKPDEGQSVLRENRYEDINAWWLREFQFKAAANDPAIVANISSKLKLMRMHKPTPTEEGDTPSDNHPPLFLEDGSVNAEAGVYVVDYSLSNVWLKPFLHLSWPQSGNQWDVTLDFSEFYYLALYSQGAPREGWVNTSETRLFEVMVMLPKTH